MGKGSHRERCRRRNTCGELFGGARRRQAEEYISKAGTHGMCIPAGVDNASFYAPDLFRSAPIKCYYFVTGANSSGGRIRNNLGECLEAVLNAAVEGSWRERSVYVSTIARSSKIVVLLHRVEHIGYAGINLDFGC